MNHADLAKAITHWLEYERLCGRSNLLSEAALKAPVGEFLVSTQGHSLEAEIPYPDDMQGARGRPRSVDFCLQRVGGANVWTKIVESKWVNGRRDLSQEIFDDLLRLEVVRRTQQTEMFERLFLLAGVADTVQMSIFARQANTGEGQRIRLFEGILPQDVGASERVLVANAGIGRIGFWRSAAGAINQTTLPLSMRVECVAHESAGVFGCWIWRISSVQRRATRAIEQ